MVTDDEQRSQGGEGTMAPDVAGEGGRQPSPTALPPGPALVIAAHPDDADIGCGGTMARLVQQGQRVVVAVVTDGSEGGEDPTVPDDVLRDRREGEQRAALRELGVDMVEFLRFPDGRLEPSLAVRRALTRLMRHHRPATVFAHDPTAHLFEGYINHPDHRAAGMAALDATFPAAGNPRAFRDLLAEGLTAHKIQQVYLFYTANANAWVDISGEPLDRKVAALRHHVSQVGSEGEEDRWLREEAANEGRSAGLAAAEGFRRIVIGP